MEDMTTVLAGISHELKTPISTISAAAEYVNMLYLRDSAEKDTVMQRMNLIRHHCLRMEMVTELFMNLAKFDTKTFSLNSSQGNIEAFFMNLEKNFNQCIKQATVMVSSKLSSNDFCCDYGILETIFLNLLSNAVKYNNKKTKRINITLSGDSDSMTVVFRDNGIGIPKREIEHIFDKFYRCGGKDRQGLGGTGLGLYIVHNMVEALNGRITVSSKLRSGTEFTVTIPRNLRKGISLSEYIDISDFFSVRRITSYLAEFTDYEVLKE